MAARTQHLFIIVHLGMSTKKEGLVRILALRTTFLIIPENDRHEASRP